MTRHLTLVSTLAGAIAIAAIGCQRSAANHKLVATGAKHSVPLYADEATYQKASHQPAGVGSETQQVDDQTPVVIISSDDSGAVVEIVDGPMKGHNGFVAQAPVEHERRRRTREKSIHVAVNSAFHARKCRVADGQKRPLR